MAREHPRSILVGSDLEDGSDVIVAAAASLAAHAGAELHLVHSLQLPWTPNDDVMQRAGFFEQVADAERRLHAQGARVLGDVIQPASEAVIVYKAYLAILDRAYRVGADLIVLGAHRGSSEPLFLGSTADHVMRSSRIPCLIVREPVRFPVARIGVATDFSKSAGEAFQLALAWASNLTPPAADDPDQGREVRLVHVAHPMILAGDPDLAASIEEQKLRQIEEAQAIQEEAGAQVVSEILWHVEPTEAIVDWVREREIGLLFLGTHGGGIVTRALIGSLAASMARLTPCPVMLVPPPLWEVRRSADEPPG